MTTRLIAVIGRYILKIIIIGLADPGYVVMVHSIYLNTHLLQVASFQRLVALAEAKSSSCEFYKSSTYDHIKLLASYPGTWEGSLGTG